MLQKNEIIQKLKDIKPILVKQFDLDQIGLFGSYVRNDAKEDSVIDLLVRFKKPIGWELVDIINFLKDFLSKEVHVVTENSLKDEVKDSILKEVIYV